MLFRSVGYDSGVNTFFAALYTANGNLPGTLIAQWNNLSSSTTFGQCCGLVTITGISGVELTVGTSYFLVLGPMKLNSTTSETWNLNSTGATGLVLYANNGCQNGSGNGCSWNSKGTQTLGAFDVLGSSSTLYSNLGTGANVYQCCSGWQVSGSGAVNGRSLANRR